MPTASLCTTPFLELAARQSRLFGCPELPVVHIPSRLADRTPAEIGTLAAGAIDAVRAALTRGQPPEQE